MGEIARNPGFDAPPLIDWAVAERALPGEATSGDLFLVKPFTDGILTAVVDGLGHGEEAAVAARQAVGILAAHADESVVGLIVRCHEGLRRTRGAVISLAAFNADEHTITWLGVGNVEGVLHRGRPSSEPAQRLLLRRGVVGYQLPVLRSEVHPVAGGDTLILATDGVRPEFAEESNAFGAPQQIAERILKQYGKSSDDALVFVARYLGMK